jgi:putative transposase
VPWKETQLEKIREEFVLRALEPDANVAELCREYRVSRKTGYKWIERFKARGVAGLADLSRRPHSSPVHATGEAVLNVLEQRRAHARWGPRKLRRVLLREMAPGEVPSERTIARILDRAGEVRSSKRRARNAPTAPPDESLVEPNDVWTVDFKGYWNSTGGERCEPLTVRDAYSRFVFEARLMRNRSADSVRSVFHGPFKEYGLPRALQMDNGTPFVSTRAPGGMTTLSAWWVSLGIRLVRGRLGHPEDNGAHERMHLDMRYELEDVAETDFVAQQQACDRWRKEFNYVRPHEALGMATPAERYRASPRVYAGVPVPKYPLLMPTRRVSSGGRFRYRNNLVRAGQGLAGYDIGIEEISEVAIKIHFYAMDLGEFRLNV